MIGQPWTTSPGLARRIRPWWLALARACGIAVVLAAMIAAFSAMAIAHSIELRSISFADVPGWQHDDHGEALGVLQRSCDVILRSDADLARGPAFGGAHADWRDVCRQAEGLALPRARSFFESRFVPVVVSDPDRPQGLFTGYFEPEVAGSRSRGGPYQVPLYRRPGDLEAFDAAARQAAGVAYGRRSAGRPVAYFTRKEIETGALAGQGLELVWLTDWADAFFLQIQGSGRVRLDDGSLMRLAFAGKSGRPYTAVGGVLVERNEIPLSEISMQSIRRWMEHNPAAARELMWTNESFIFFREVPSNNPNLGPPGAQGVPLTPRRSLAVDRAFWAMGTPVWLDAEVPSGPDGALQPFRRLLIAQDTGSAIKGRARGDVFWGTGEAAAAVAGRMKSPGTMIALLPRAVAARLGLAPQ